MQNEGQNVWSISIRNISALATWELRHRVMWPHMSMDYVKLPKDQEGEHFGLFADHKLVAVVSIFYEDKQAQFRKLATEVHAQGKGYGSKLVCHIIAHAKTKGLAVLWCNARKDKVGFYQKFGFKTTQREFSKNGIAYVVVQLKLC